MFTPPKCLHHHYPPTKFTVSLDQAQNSSTAVIWLSCTSSKANLGKWQVECVQVFLSDLKNRCLHCWIVSGAGETTALGEPKPGIGGRQPFQYHPPRYQGSSLVQLLALGFGVGLVFAVLGRIF